MLLLKRKEPQMTTPTAHPARAMKRYIRYTRNGGMRFLRIHRLQLSFCICRNGLG